MAGRMAVQKEDLSMEQMAGRMVVQREDLPMEQMAGRMADLEVDLLADLEVELLADLVMNQYSIQQQVQALAEMEAQEVLPLVFLLGEWGEVH